MSVVVMVLAGALVVYPPRGTRFRLRAIVSGATGKVPGPRRALPAAGTALVGGSVGALLGGPLPALAAALVAVVGQRRWRARREAIGAHRTALALVAALEVLVAELRVGAHPALACAVAAEEVDGPVAAVFSAAAARARLGASAADGLRAAEPGLDAELDRVAAVWRVAEERGVALADLVEAVRCDLVGRLRFRSRTQAALAGPRATASVLAALPLLGIVLGQAIGAAPVQLLLRNRPGGVLLLLGTVLVCAGLAWSERITAKAVC